MLTNEEYQILLKSKRQLEAKIISTVKAEILLGLYAPTTSKALWERQLHHNNLAKSKGCPELCVNYFYISGANFS